MTRYAPLWLQSGSYGASVDRRLIGALWPAARCDGGAVTATGVGMGLQAAPGYCAIPAANATGSVLCAWDAPETVSPPLDPAPPAGTNRIDLVICQARGADLDGGTNNDFVITYAKGAEAASPVAPATPPGALALAQVRVNGGAASIAPADITDVRPGSLAVPAVPPATAPRGYVAGVKGPAATVTCGTTASTLIVLNATLTAGRRYRLYCVASGTQQTSSATPRVDIAGPVDLGGRLLDSGQSPTQVNGARFAFGAMPVTPASGGAVTFTMTALTTAGTFAVGANGASMQLDDVGSQ
jgi:hypothetical protein